MSQPTVFGDAEVTAFAHVVRADGTEEFYRVADGAHTAITKDEYESENA